MLINFPDNKKHVYRVAKAYSILSDRRIEDIIGECVQKQLADMITNQKVDLTELARNKLDVPEENGDNDKKGMTMEGNA